MLVVLALVLLSPGWATGRINSASDLLQASPVFSVTDSYEPSSYLYDDVVRVFEPWLILLGRAIQQHELPLWNPFQGLGAPHLASGQAALFFPTTWIAAVLPLPLGLLLLHVSKLVLVGFSTYLYLKVVGQRHGGALFGATAFTLCGFVAVWLYWPLPNVAAFLPVLLLAVELAIRRRGQYWPYVLTAAATALALFAGHPETFAHIGMTVGLYTIVRTLTAGGRARQRVKVLARLGASAVVGLLLAAVQILPTLEYLQHSFAATNMLRDETIVVRLQNFVLTVLPELLGRQSEYFGMKISSNYNEVVAGSVGLVVVVLSVLSVLHSWRRRSVVFFAVLAVFSFMVAYRIPPVYDLFRMLPLTSSMLNVRFGLIAAFALCFMAGALVSAVVAGEYRTSRRKVLLATAATIAVVALLAVPAVRSVHTDVAEFMAHLTWYVPSAVGFALVLTGTLVFLKQRWLAVALGLLLLFERGIAVAAMEPATEPKYVYPVTPAVAELQRLAGHDRVLGLDYSFNPNAGTAYGVYQLQNYDGVLVKGFVDVVETHGHMPGGHMPVINAQPAFLSAANVRYLVTRHGHDVASILSPGYSTRVFREVYDDGKAVIYENLDVWPRATFSDNPAKVDLGKRPMHLAVLREETLNTVTVYVEAPHDGHLFIANTYMPGWHASIDGGASIDVQQADLNFQSVPITKGEHTVVLKYLPRSFTLGVAVSGGTALVLVGAVIADAVRRRRARKVINLQQTS